MTNAIPRHDIYRFVHKALRAFMSVRKNLDEPAGRDIAPGCAPPKRAILRIPRRQDDADPAFDECGVVLAELKQWGLRMAVARNDILSRLDQSIGFSARGKIAIFSVAYVGSSPDRSARSL
jgi:hypothetical protein